MIEAFKCKDTEAVFNDKCPPRFLAFRPQAERKLLMLHKATALKDLRSPPGNGLEALEGDRKGQWSIRINKQWRICFKFNGKDAFDVEIVDYH
jgi:proteic killer suppression protein